MSKKEIQLTKEFKIQATKAIIAISVFILSYLIILLLALILTALCIAGGISLIALKPSFLTILLGIGLSSLGILIVIFLIKFIFKSHKTDRSHLVEINESQHPKLFKTINDIVLEVGTSFPMRVYISAEVNAAVFYDSSFWSMFFPVKKNLIIGLGLVNTATKEELKAILAHEFGHFSQKTMKVGSYVYNVNQVIFNMLYDNESYENLIQRWAEVSGYFSIFVVIAVKINESIQWILRKLYEMVNKDYLGLSREMEFHADEIAASVTGYEPLKKSLLRMALADTSYNNVLNFYNNKISENIKSENIYNNQSLVMSFLSQVNKLTLTNGLPDISMEEQSKYDKSKLVIKDQWASHPSINDRIDRLEKTGFNSFSSDDRLANELFENIENLQIQLTQKLFEVVSYEGQTKHISTSEFIEEYKYKVNQNSFPDIYNGYYDNKNPIIFDLENSISFEKTNDYNNLFSDEKVDWVYTSIALQNDMENLKNIYNKSFKLKSFDYDGVRYRNNEAELLLEKLKTELTEINEKIKRNDVGVFNLFLELEAKQNKQPKLKHIYNEFFSFDEIFDKKNDYYIQLINELQFVNVTTPFEEIKSNFENIKSIEENLKIEIALLLTDDILKSEITGEIRDNLEKYTSKTWEYFGGTSYFDENLNLLYTAMHNYSFLLSRKYFLMKKGILQYQFELIKTQQ
ncbi:MAG: M48 family metallopeptidase [Bacteroidota bacterium]